MIKRSRDLTRMMMEQGFIPEAPSDGDEHPLDAKTLESAF
jgi:hypothetical protein